MKYRVVLIILSMLLVPLTLLAREMADGQEITSVEERRILVSIEEGYDKLAEREAELDSREMQLKTLQDEVDKKLAAMQKLRKELLKLLNRKQEEEGRRVGELSGIYEKMEPTKAARLIKALDKQLAIELLLGVKKKVAGEILNNLDPKFATALTKAFAEIPVKEKSGN